jgi:hypothetical protein
MRSTHAASLVEAPNFVFSGTSRTEARARVGHQDGHTELGRIAALSQHPVREESPLER